MRVPALHSRQRQNRAPLGPRKGLLKSNAEIKLQSLTLDEPPKLSSSPLTLCARTISVYLITTGRKREKSTLPSQTRAMCMTVRSARTLFGLVRQKMHYKILSAESVETCGEATHSLHLPVQSALGSWAGMVSSWRWSTSHKTSEFWWFSNTLIFCYYIYPHLSCRQQPKFGNLVDIKSSQDVAMVH